MKMYELLSDENRWTQGSFAKDINDYDVNPWSDDAVCYCIAGAAMRCYDILSVEKLRLIRENLTERNNKHIPESQTLSDWNDSIERTYQEVYDLLKRLDV